ncbi:MAG: amidase family protein [Sedimentitalea sp.]
MPELWEQTATQLAAAVRAGDVSAQQVCEAHLDRLDAVNPGLNAVVQTDHDGARLAARGIDAQIANGEDPGAMAGVPITIKVNVDQQGHATTNGLRVQKDLIARADNPVVANLRRAGAVIVGRTNTPAFSMRWFTDNGVHGQTLNPRDAGLTPGGSSGGAASAVASGICAMAHGTDIAGSVRYPAYACGLHGLRPTLGRVSAWNPTLPDRHIGAQLMAVSGPIARSIDDIRLSLAAMAAPVAGDPTWVPVPLAFEPAPLRAALCVAPDGMAVSSTVSAALRDTAERLRAAGWQVDEVTPPPLRPAADINAQLWMAEARATRDMITREDDANASFVFKQMTDASPEMDMAALMGALQKRIGLIREWQAFLADYPILICPVSGTLPFAQQLDVSSEQAFADVLEAQLTQRALPALGLPCLSVATGQIGRKPVGVQLVADRFREDTLLAAGAVIEAACGAPTVCTPA